MAVYTNTDASVYIDGFGLHAFVNELDLSGTADEKDFTTVRSGGWRVKKAGLMQHDLMASGFQDYAATGVDPAFPITGLGGLNTFTVAPNLLATIGDPCFIGQGVLNDYNPFGGAVGDEAKFSFGWRGSAQLVRGKVIHPEAARTATGSGTTTTFTAPTASQALYAAFHVVSVSGAGSITFTIQTDDNSGMTTPTTRITSSAFTSIGGAFSSLAGALTGETHIRTGYTITGFTSVTFAVSIGVL